jgi:hypothetical protein
LHAVAAFSAALEGTAAEVAAADSTASQQAHYSAGLATHPAPSSAPSSSKQAYDDFGVGADDSSDFDGWSGGGGESDKAFGGKAAIATKNRFE